MYGTVNNIYTTKPGYNEPKLVHQLIPHSNKKFPPYYEVR